MMRICGCVASKSRASRTAISTGAYGYPIEQATQIAIREARAYEHALRIVFCCFSKADAEVYRRYLATS